MAARKGKAVATIQEQIAKEAAGVGDSLGSAGGNRLRVTQGKKFVGPDGVKVPGPINVVILDFNSQNHFFSEAYDADNPAPPDCFAISEPAGLGGRIDSMVPSPNSPDKQAESCNVCPMNQFGSAPNGKGKACKNTRVLATINPDAEDPSEAPILPLSVSPMALKGFDAYAKILASKERLPVSVITQLDFDEDVDYPVLLFSSSAMNGLLEDHWVRRSEAQMLLVQEPDLTPRDDDTSKRKPAAKKKATKKKKTSRRAA